MSERLWPLNTPIVIAHRAGGHEEPENSLAAFEHMLAKGFRFIETDSHATSDGVVVLFHDSELERTTDGVGRIEDKTWEELASVRDRSGNRIVRLDETLMTCRDAILNIDAKNSHVVPHLARTILDHDAVGQVSLASFSECRLKALRRKVPGVVSSLGTAGIALLWIASRGGPLSWIAHLVPGGTRRVEAVQVPESYGPVRLVDRRFVDFAHARGYAVHVWTINDVDVMRHLLDLGVDGIITDIPTTAAQVIEGWLRDRDSTRGM